MRLEARDRKNPHLICVATISAIDWTRSDSLLIHFDGWGNKYVGFVGPLCGDWLQLRLLGNPIIARPLPHRLLPVTGVLLLFSYC